MLSFFAGLGLGLSLIIAIGAQNAYVLRQGIRRQHVIAVVIVCALSDAVLIVAGVAGLGFIIERMPWLIVIAQWLGAAFLFCYGALAAWRAIRGTTGSLDTTAGEETPRSGRGLRTVILTVLALTWLNPHVYLDTVIMLGSIAATHGEERWVFAAGAIVASVVWFSALGYGARALSRKLSSPSAWRILDGLIALIMITLAITLVMQAIS